MIWPEHFCHDYMTPLWRVHLDAKSFRSSTLSALPVVAVKDVEEGLRRQHTVRRKACTPDFSDIIWSLGNLFILMVQQGVDKRVDDRRCPGEDGGNQVEDGEGQLAFQHVAYHCRQERDEEDDKDGQHRFRQLEVFSQVHPHHCQAFWI